MPERARAQTLHRGPVLDRVGPDAMHRIVVRATQVQVERREPLWRPGDPVTALYWVRSGIVAERIPLPGGREFLLAFRGRSDVVGEVGALAAAFHGAARHETLAEAHEEATLYALPLAELVALLRADPGLAMGLAALTAERRQATEARLASVPYLSAPARMASVLLSLAETFGVRDSRGVIVNLRLTHRDLAGLAGASRETASVALLDWRRDGLVEVEGKRVVLLDQERLAAVARDERPSVG
ncbi:MAG: Crp/Fnr family transcriptional regulator [Myxococcota bacterium]